MDHFCINKAACYVDQIDQNIPMLTVRETLSFSEFCLGRSGMLRQLCLSVASPEGGRSGKLCVCGVQG